MRQPRTHLLLTAFSCLALAACPAGDEKKGDAKKADAKKSDAKKADAKKTDDEKADDGGDGADEKLPELDLSGPTPPDSSAVFFAVDGALIPVACFDKDAGKLLHGKACLGLVAKDQEVLLSSEYGRALDKIGDPRNALCEVADKPTSLGTPALDTGQAYEWATWPKSLGTKTEQVKSDTKSDVAVVLSDDEKTALTQAVVAKKPGAAKGELRCNQKADLDIDGDGTKERFFSVLVGHPKSPDRSLFSGLYMAPGGDLGSLRLIESSKRDLDVLTIRGAVDLEGDGKRELWLGLTFDGGSGDRMVKLDGDTATPLGKWSCGA